MPCNAQLWVWSGCGTSWQGSLPVALACLTGNPESDGCVAVSIWIGPGLSPPDGAGRIRHRSTHAAGPSRMRAQRSAAPRRQTADRSPSESATCSRTGNAAIGRYHRDAAIATRGAGLGALPHPSSRRQPGTASGPQRSARIRQSGMSLRSTGTPACGLLDQGSLARERTRCPREPVP
jgi:hypothetical protein